MTDTLRPGIDADGGSYERRRQPWKEEPLPVYDPAVPYPGRLGGKAALTGAFGLGAVEMLNQMFPEPEVIMGEPVVLNEGGRSGLIAEPHPDTPLARDIHSDNPPMSGA